MFVRGIGILCVAILAIFVFSTPSGATIWTVSSSSTLDNAASGARTGDTIICSPGDYYPSHAMSFSYANITLKGSTGNRDDVRIHGAGMNVDAGDSRNNLIQFAASGFTIKDLTVQDVNQNGIQIHGEDNITSGNILNVHLINIGERAIKGSGPVSQGQYNDANVTVNGCLIEQTIPRSGYAASGDLDYIGGIDVMGTKNWTVTNNVFKNIHGATGGARGAIFIWNGTLDTIMNNTILGCDRGISLGNPSSNFGPDHSIVANNVIVRGADIGLEICSTDSVSIYNNTIYSASAGYSRTVSVYGPQTSLVAENNIIRGAVSQSGGTWTSTNNIIDSSGATITSAWFKNVGAGDLHLTAAATGAINQGIVLPQVTTDMDGVARSNSPDIGADERPLYPGDANKDGAVNVVDLGVLAKYYDTASGATWAMADFSGDGAVNVVDLGVLAKYYDWVSPAGDQVPEPASISLLALGALALLRRKR